LFLQRLSELLRFLMEVELIHLLNGLRTVRTIYGQVSDTHIEFRFDISSPSYYAYGRMDQNIDCYY
jgi:hypothetical protein